MENRKLVRLDLAISLSLNVAIVLWALHLSKSHSSLEVSGTSKESDNARNVTGSIIAPTALQSGLGKGGVDFGDLDNLASNLRLQGYPPALIRSIVTKLIDEKLSGRRAALLNIEVRRPYWEFGFDRGVSAETLKARRDYYEERNGLLKRALGNQAFEPDDETREKQRIYWGDISPENIALLEQIHRDYDDLKESLRGEHHGFSLPGERANTDQLDREMEADIKKSLTDREYEDYSIRVSPTANWLRVQLGRFGPTEQEFRGLFQALNAPSDSAFGGVANNKTPDTTRLLAEAKRIMPPDRYNALEQSMSKSSLLRKN